MERKNKETVGSLARELLLKKDTKAPTPNEAMREQLEDYDKNIYECLDKHKKLYDSDFYIVVLTKRERLLKNVLRHYFFGRLSCPTPDYDQVVYRYDKARDNLEFLWVIPDKKTSHYMVENVPLIPPEQFSLLNYVLQFKDETLYRLAKKLNNEEFNSNALKDK